MGTRFTRPALAAAALTMLAGCGGISVPEQSGPADEAVTLSVVGEGIETAEIRYYVAAGPSWSSDGVSLPWSQTLFDPRSAQLSLDASSPVPPGGERAGVARLTCLIKIDGEVVARDSSLSGDTDDVLSCSAGLPAKNVP